MPSVLLDFLVGVLLDCDLLELRLGDQTALQLGDLRLAHLFPQLFHLFVDLAVLGLYLQDLLEAAVGLHFPSWVKAGVLRPTRALALRW